MSAAAILLEIAIKTSLVLALAVVVTGLMARRAAASTRHLVWAAALAAALLMPVLVLFGPTWRVAPLPDTWAAGVRAVIGGSIGASRADADVWPNRPSPGSHAPLIAEPGGRADATIGRGAVASPVTTGLVSWTTLPDLAVRAWALGAAIAVFSLGVGLMWAAWFTRQAVPPRVSEWDQLYADAVARLGVTAPARLLMSSHVGVPVASGIFRPTILLPLDADAWAHERRTVVLLHELAHVKRRDCLTQTLAYVAWALHWYNPLAFVALSRLRAEQERACDDLVLNAGTSPADYADHLCEIASTARRTLVPVWSSLAIARPSRLAGRVAAILDETRRRQAPSWRLSAAAIGVLGLGVVPLAAVHGSVAAQAIAILPTSALTATTAATAYATLMPALNPGDVKTALTASEHELGQTLALAAPLAARPPVQEFTVEGGRTFLSGCLACHNSTRRTANLAFDELLVEPLTDHVEVWEKVIRRLRTGLHPPAGQPRPGRAETEAFSASLEAAIDGADQRNWTPGRAAPLGDRELAARVAKFLWNADPDTALLTFASSGGWHDPVRLRAQVQRMLADSRADAFLTGFFGDWLHLKNLSSVKPDPEQFPGFDALREAFRQETALFLASQVRDDHPLTDLLTANYTFLNDRLAEHYGIGGITGSQFRRVALPNDTRAGILGHASLLSVTSFATRTSPVVRGKWLLEEWLGVPPPPPPANVPALKPADPEHPATIRTRMEQHRKSPVCASCHTTMDSLGFALENFDAIGRWRTTEEGLAIDASGTLPDGSRFEGPAQLRAVLMDRRDAVESTMVLKLLAYALGRPARYSDMPAVRTITWGAAASHDTWSSVIAGIVQSAPFAMRRLD